MPCRVFDQKFNIIAARCKAISSPICGDFRPQAEAQGTGANGIKLLCIALASCLCNDICREAEKFQILVIPVEVIAKAGFGAAGEWAKTNEAALHNLIRQAENVAEIHNPLRLGMPTQLVDPKLIVM